MIVYFTGTGNSRHCARLLAGLLEDQCVDAFHWIREGLGAELQSEKPWVFVSPTYAWQLPRVFRDFIRFGRFGGSREAYFVLTCGGETGNAVQGIRKLCQEKEFDFRGLMPVVMPDNYLVMFPSPKPEEIRTLLAAAPARLEEAAQRIRAGETFPPVQVGLMDKVKSGPINEGMHRYFIRTKKFMATGDCVSCGKCETVCPLGNIRLEGGKPVWGDRCTHCMACLNLCPTGAIEYGKATRGKERYHCPDDQGPET